MKTLKRIGFVVAALAAMVAVDALIGNNAHLAALIVAIIIIAMLLYSLLYGLWLGAKWLFPVFTLACLLFCGQAWAGKKTISELRPGECGFTVPWAFDWDTGYLNYEYPVYESPGGTVEMRACRENTSTWTVSMKARDSGVSKEARWPLQSVVTADPRYEKDALIRQWAKSGEICRVLDHQWIYGPKGETHTFSENPPAMRLIHPRLDKDQRYCPVCKTLMMKIKTERWEVVKP